ncbi:hypothetical protein BKA82DRAFT_4182332 [Pisolithus tinctorius]|nr:hypothetical protein BKA82DRAFT_4182332 [Pisolithus tinctorius]
MHNLRSTKTTPFCHSCLDMLSKVWLRPKAVHDNEVVDEFANDYTYFACIKFINSVYDVSAIKTWEKISAGMTKTYAAEVLGKLPVIQHSLFGSILYEGEKSAYHGHIHEGQGACAGCLSRVLLLQAGERARQDDRGTWDTTGSVGYYCQL